MKRMSFLAAGLIVLGAAAAVFASNSKSPKPDWIDNAGGSAQYPAQQFMTGVGIANDRATAEDRARGEIAKIFKVDVKVAEAVSASESHATGPKGTKSSSSNSVSQDIQTASQKVLEGVRIAETWQDPQTSVLYALAVLDRNEASQALQDKISRFDADAKRWKDELAPETGKFAKVRAAMRLVSALDARAKLNAEMIIVRPSAASLSPVDEAAARDAAFKALSSLNVLLSVDGDGAGAITTGLTQGLAKAGLQVMGEGSSDNPDVLVTAKTVTKALETQTTPGFHWSESSASVTLKDVKAAKTFGQFDVSDREASADTDVAARRSQDGLGDKAADAVQKAVKSYFENQ